jgi:hypothetical protein
MRSIAVLAIALGALPALPNGKRRSSNSEKIGKFRANEMEMSCIGNPINDRK